MERKTMGNFIAILRKANGMTQVDLAEKLNVSDKTISRWERGEGAPDLSLLPIIADIFGVTADELLCGERNPVFCGNSEMDEMLIKRNQRHLKRLLKINLLRFKNQNFIFIGLMIIGFIGSIISNCVFNRGFLGFFAASVFYIIGITYGIITTNVAFSKVSETELTGYEINEYKRSVITITEGNLYFSLINFALTLPLLLIGDPFFGLMTISWLKLGLLLGIFTCGLCFLIHNVLSFILIRNGVYPLDDKEQDGYRLNLAIKRKYGLILAGIFVITLPVHWYITERYIQQKGNSLVGDFSLGQGRVDDSEGIIHSFNQYSGSISDDETLSDSFYSGNKGVLHTYVEQVGDANAYLIYRNKLGFPPFIIYFYRAYFVGSIPLGKIMMEIPNYGLFFVYLLETAMIMILYYKKRNKLC